MDIHLRKFSSLLMRDISRPAKNGYNRRESAMLIWAGVKLHPPMTVYAA